MWCAVLLWLLAAAAGLAQTRSADNADAAASAAPWTAGDTKLANHYIRLLEQKPEYGNVLDLLWGLYEKRGQTGLLLDYFKRAATPATPEPRQQGPAVARTLYGHLLRKDEQFDAALAIYTALLDEAPDDGVALRGAAEISAQLERADEALPLYARLVERTPITTEDGAVFRLRQAAL